MMDLLRTLTSIAVATGVAAAVGAGIPFASAQGNCEWYAKTALKQQQDNERMKCGLRGPEWSANLADHMRWCSTVAPDIWRVQAQKRDAELAKCAKK